MELRKPMPYAFDINKDLLKIGDRVSITQERMDKYNPAFQSSCVGEVLVIKEIYAVPSFYGEELLGLLYYEDGSGSICNSDLRLYKKE